MHRSSITTRQLHSRLSRQLNSFTPRLLGHIIWRGGGYFYTGTPTGTAKVTGCVTAPGCLLEGTCTYEIATMYKKGKQKGQPPERLQKMKQRGETKEGVKQKVNQLLYSYCIKLLIRIKTNSH